MPNLFLDYKNMAIHKWLFLLSTLVWSCCQLLRFSIWLYKRLYHYKHTINPMKIYQTNKWLFFLSSVPFSFCSKWWNQNDLSNFHVKKMIECTIFHVVHYAIRLFYWCGKISLIVFFILVVVLHMLDLYALASK